MKRKAPTAPVQRARLSMRSLPRLVPLALTSVIVLIFLLNVVFYSGGSLPGDTLWYLESGRFTFRWNYDYRQSFFVDFNSQGLSWKPDWGASSITIPLWIPLVLCSFWTWRTMRTRPQTPTA